MPVQKKIKWGLAIALLAFVLWCSPVVFGIASYVIKGQINQPKGTCVNVPILVEKEGYKISCEAIVPHAASYSLDLYFMSSVADKVMRNKIEGIVKANVLHSASKPKSTPPLKFYVEIKNESQEVILKRTLLTPSLSASSSDYIAAEILIKRFQPGTYKISLELKEDIPAFKDVPTQFQFKLFMPK